MCVDPIVLLTVGVMAANKGRLHGKFAVVTGAAQGIGRETGQTLSETQLLEVGKSNQL